MLVKLKTNRLTFREITYDDLIRIHALNTIPEVDFYNTLGIPKNIVETQNLIDSIVIAQSAFPRIRYVWLIEDQFNHFIGLSGILLGKLNYQTAEVWYKLDPEFWNKGFATEMVKEILRFSFDDLKLHRVTAGCVTENIASIKLLEKCGFRKEGYHKKALPIRGKWIDNFEYAILEEEFFQNGQ
jgi:RimJ/RimL family protein N-acetyltransferase